MKPILFFVLAVVLVVACGKNKFETTPKLKILSSSTDVVPVNGSLNVVIEFSDKEGDLSDTLYVTKQRMNARVEKTLFDTLQFAVPKFPDNSLGQFELNLPYQGGLVSAEIPPRIPGSNPPQYEPDTLNIKFLVKDKANHKSDSVFLNNIVILR